MPRDLWRTARNSDIAKQAIVGVARCMDQGGCYPYIVAAGKSVFISSGSDYREVTYSAPFRFYTAEFEDNDFFWIELDTSEVVAVRRSDTIRGPFVVPSERPIWVFDVMWRQGQSETTMFFDDVDGIDGQGRLHFTTRDGKRIAVDREYLR